jgi:hypothetical protein
LIMAGSVKRRPDGTYRARYRDAGHREHVKHFDRKEDARRWLSQEVAIARGEWIDPVLPKITVGEWMRRWHGQQVQLTPSTLVRYDVAMRCQIFPTWDLVALSRVTHSEVSSWVQRLSVSGLAPATVPLPIGRSPWLWLLRSRTGGWCGTSRRAFGSHASLHARSGF